MGAAYHRAALAEIGEGSIDVSSTLANDGATLLAEYIQRLNPGVQVDIVSRSKLFELLNSSNLDAELDVEDEDRFDVEGNHIEESDDEEQESISLGTNPVVVCVDRSITSQLIMNDACRSKSQSRGSGGGGSQAKRGQRE